MTLELVACLKQLRKICFVQRCSCPGVLEVPFGSNQLIISQSAMAAFVGDLRIAKV